jgi:hypothetical protein
MRSIQRLARGRGRTLPVAERMGIASASRDPALAVAFWNRFWADRGTDFRC